MVVPYVAVFLWGVCGHFLATGAPPDGGIFGLLSALRDPLAHGGRKEEGPPLQAAGQARQPGTVDGVPGLFDFT